MMCDLNDKARSDLEPQLKLKIPCLFPIPMLIPLAALFCILSLVICGPSMALLASSGSLPPSIIYPNKPPYTATTPFIASNQNDYSIAIWYDSLDAATGTGKLHAATYISALHSENSPTKWTLSSPNSFSDVFVPINSHAQLIGMDEKGNAIVVWKNNKNRILASRLEAGKDIWSTFSEPLNRSLNSAESPSLSVAQNGNAIAMWVSANSSKYQVSANIYDVKSNRWKGEQIVFESSLTKDSTIYNLAVDSEGNAIAAVHSTSNSLQVTKLNFETNTWHNIASFPVNADLLSFTISLDNEGNVLLVSLEGKSIWAATLLHNQTSFTNKTQISSNANNLFSLPTIKIDFKGNAIAVWADNAGLGSARYSKDTQSWNILPVLNLNGPVPADIKLSMNALGNAAASWSIFDSSGGYIQTSVLAKGGSLWNLLIPFPIDSKHIRNPQICFLSHNSLLAVWENDIGPFLSGTINFAEAKFDDIAILNKTGES